MVLTCSCDAVYLIKEHQGWGADRRNVRQRFDNPGIYQYPLESSVRAK